MSGSAREIKSVSAELKRLRVHMKKLQEQKKLAEGRLYSYMVKYNHEKIEDISRDKIKPKGVVQRKKPKEKKSESIQLLFSSGIADPENVWDELQKISKPIKKDEHVKDDLFG